MNFALGAVRSLLGFSSMEDEHKPSKPANPQLNAVLDEEPDQSMGTDPACASVDAEQQLMGALAHGCISCRKFAAAALFLALALPHRRAQRTAFS